MKPIDLSKVSTDQLLEEIVRRRNLPEKRIVRRWCHNCANFKPWLERGLRKQMPEDFNPCTLGHAMSFKVPEGHEAPEGGGFYRPACPDRTAKPEAKP